MLHDELGFLPPGQQTAAATKRSRIRVTNLVSLIDTAGLSDALMPLGIQRLAVLNKLVVKSEVALRIEE